MNGPPRPWSTGRPQPATCTALAAAGLDLGEVERVVRLAFDEDLALGPDLTTQATVAHGALASGQVVARSAGTLAAIPVAAAVLEILAGDAVSVTARRADGERVSAGDVVLDVEGPAWALLTAERTMLNLLGHLSGVATLTRAWVDAVAGTGAALRDTRKTTPGLRALEKYAVRCGGGVNHRMALGDQALIKDNHVLAAGGVAAAFRAVRRAHPDVVVQVECDTVAQVRQALDAGARLLLLDNMPLEQLRQSVALARARATDIRLEASGGLSLQGAREVAETGVDYLAVGALTHSAPVLDLGFDLATTSR